jgi:hypothetical protein
MRIARKISVPGVCPNETVLAAPLLIRKALHGKRAAAHSSAFQAKTFAASRNSKKISKDPGVTWATG